MVIETHLSLSGCARNSCSELTADELKAETGTGALLSRLYRVFFSGWQLALL